ncbi:uncharacterized protein V1510DRAFT_412861 [Dipodascopsis tothii]|uniref:uncharacterized protein n=1 Tax=Dipodascopsis tothii TaxID=44089 RepID=UPI0034CFBD28
MEAHRAQVFSLYRRALRTSLNWTIHRGVWRQEALAIRQAFEANKDNTDPRFLRNAIAETEAKLAELRHPDPYIPPSRPGGSKYERNVPPPLEEPIPAHGY